MRGLLKSRTVPGSTTTGQTVTWTRNALGQVTRAETKDGSGAAVLAYDYTFDVAHRLASVSDSRTGRTIVYGWTPGGRLSSIALGSEPGSPLWRFQYDGTGRLTGISAPNGQTVAMSLDAVGRLTEKTWPDGARSTYSWHPEGSLASISHAAGSRVLFAQNFGFDDWGNRNSSTETHDLTAISRSYTYDARDRLKTETTNGVARSFGFDVFGNRTSRTEGSSTTNYLFDAAHQLKEVQGGVSGRLVYDRNGNLKKYCSGSASGSDSDCTGTDVLALAWDGLNQLIQASRAGSTETYAYDDSGRRIRKSVGGSSTHYQYDGPDILVEYNNPAGAPSALYVHGAGMDEPLMRLTGDVGSPQAQVAYYAQDGVGSVVATFGEPEASVNLAREAGVSIAQGAGGAYTVGGVASNPATLNNGETRASGGHWTVTSGRTLDIQLAGSRSVSEVVLIGNPGTIDDAAPSETGTWASSSQFDTSRYTVQAWSGSAWQTVASRSGNTKHIVRLAFGPVTTDRIRVIPTDDASNGQTPNDNLVSLTEIEVRSPAGAGEIRAQRFDAWGKLEQAAGSVPTYGYTGREPDATGLIHYRARYYHPELGRFVSRDPLGLAAGINPYAYAGGNPVLFNDPDGLMARLAWNAASGYWAENNVGIRLGGAMQAANGVGEFALGGAIGIGAGWTGVGGVVGGGLMVLGADQASAGFQTLVSGRSTPSLVNQGFQAAGASPTQAAWGEAFVNIGASAGASGLVQGGRSFVQAAGVADDVFAANAEVTVYRVFGGDARAQGFSWTTKDPRTVSNFRDAAGLPSGGPSGATNTADFLIKGRANASDVIKSRSALPLDGNKGGLPELIIDPKNVRITDFSVLKP